MLPIPKVSVTSNNEVTMHGSFGFSMTDTAVDPETFRRTRKYTFECDMDDIGDILRTNENGSEEISELLKQSFKFLLDTGLHTLSKLEK